MSNQIAPTAPAVSKDEHDLIRQHFTDDLLKTIRAMFYGLDVTDADRAIIKTTFANDNLRKVMWKRFCPSLDRESLIGTIQDAWIGSESMIFGQAPQTIRQAVLYKEKSIQMTIQALGLLADPNGKAPSLLVDIHNPDDELQVNLLARNAFIKHVDFQLLSLKLVANAPVEGGKTSAQDSSRQPLTYMCACYSYQHRSRSSS
jgi:hypothetical protein